MDLCFQHLSRGHMHVPVWYAKRETFAKKIDHQILKQLDLEKSHK